MTAAWLCHAGAFLFAVKRAFLLEIGLAQLGAAVVLHLHHGRNGMTAVVVQLGVLGQQFLGVVGQIKGGVIAQCLDPQYLAQPQHCVKAGTSHTVVQRTVHSGQRYAHRKSELPHAFVLLADLFADDLC